MAWNTTGNAGTNPASNFLGTTDNNAVVVKANGKEVLRADPSGRLGVGTAGPQNLLHVGPGSSSIAASRVNAVFAGNGADAGVAIAQNTGVNLLVQASGAGAFIGTTSNHPLVFRTNDLDRMVVQTNGNLQVGRGASSIAASRINAVFSSNNPDAGIGIAQNSGVNVLLQASGAGGFIGTTSNHPLVLRSNDLDRVVIETNGNVRFNGDILLANADCAEDFDVCETADAAPGTVMVLGADGRLQPCGKAYDKRVAGVVSGAGQYKPAIVLDRRQAQPHRKAIALVGKAYCKVDAAHGAIDVGDLLTTSDTPGHAMKAADPGRAFGAVIGKALRRLDEGQGLVPILIALQ